MAVLTLEIARNDCHSESLISKVKFDKVNSQGKKKPEIPVSGPDNNPSSVELDKNAVAKHILSQSPNLYKQSGELMSSEGYIRIPRSLRNSPEWQELKLKQRHVFETILLNARWCPQTHNINGKIFIVNPGQLYITIRQLVDLCNKNVHFKDDKVDLPFVQRSVSKFFMLNWIDTRNDTGKTLITLTYSEIYEYFNQKTIQETIPLSIQDRYTNEERKKEEDRKGTINDVESPLSYQMKKEKIDDSYMPSAPSYDCTPEPDMPRISEEQFKEDFGLASGFIQERKIPIKPEELERWIRKWGGHTVISNLDLMTRQKNQVRSAGAWMERALKEDWAKLKKHEPINRKFAEEFKKKHNWTELTILKKYCTIERTGYDVQFNFDPETFKAILESKHENLFRGHNGEINY